MFIFLNLCSHRYSFLGRQRRFTGSSWAIFQFMIWRLGKTITNYHQHDRTLHENASNFCTRLFRQTKGGADKLKNIGFSAQPPRCRLIAHLLNTHLYKYNYCLLSPSRVKEHSASSLAFTLCHVSCTLFMAKFSSSYEQVSLHHSRKETGNYTNFTWQLQIDAEIHNYIFLKQFLDYIIYY